MDKYHIFNLHGGNLKTNKDGNDSVWFILNDDNNICLYMNELTRGIDEEKLIGEYWIATYDNDNLVSIAYMMQDRILSLLEELAECILEKNR